MSYGLYDADLQFYPIPFYNLELMKYSSFYKRKREIVSLSPSFSPNMYKTFIVRQDFNSSYTYPKKADNIVYGGRAFSGSTYKPLPEEIERQKPDINLYSRITANHLLKKDIATFNLMKRAEHLRLSLDGQTVWKDFEKQIRYEDNAYGVIFHDYNLNQIDGAFELIQDLIPQIIQHKNGGRIGMKFPVQTYTIEDLAKWTSLIPTTAHYSLHHNHLINNADIPILVDNFSRSRALRQVTINISKDSLTEADIQRIYRSIINLRSNRLVFPLIYNESVFPGEWKQVMKLINRYNAHILSFMDKDDYFPRVEPYETLFSFTRNVIRKTYNREDILQKETVQQIFQFVRENNYDLFKDFYEYRGEEVDNVRRRN